MSLRFRAGPADAETRAVFPAFGCPSGGLWYNSELEQPTDTPHLLRCLRCAALNGRSAFRCWSCEAELTAGLPLGKLLAAGSDAGPDLAAQHSNHPAFFDALVGGSADSPTTPSTVHAPAHADAPFSAPLSAVAIDERLAAFSQHRRRVPRRLLGVAAIVVLAAASGTGAYLIQRPQPFIALDANPAPRHTAAIVEPSVDAEPVTAGIADPSRIEPPVRTEAAAPVHIESLQQPAAQAVAPPKAAPPPPPVVAAVTTARGGTPRGTRHARNTTAATLPAPIRGGSSDTVRPLPPTPAPPGACTATVAALGLCQATSAQPKE